MPLIVFLAMFVWGVIVFDQGFQVPPDAPEVYVTGKQWMWKIQHVFHGCPRNQRAPSESQSGGQDDAISEDVIHSFGIPAFRDKIDVLPGCMLYLVSAEQIGPLPDLPQPAMWNRAFGR